MKKLILHFLDETRWHIAGSVILFVAIVLSFLLSSCQGSVINPADWNPVTPVQAMAQQITTIPTATINAQATIAVAQAEADTARLQAQQAQEMARSAQLTSDAANRLLVDATVTHEAIQLSYAQMTQQAETIKIQNAQMTQQAGNATATAYATSIPLTATQQSLRDSIHTTEVAMTVNAPAVAREMVVIKLENTYGGLTYFAQVLASIALLLIPLGSFVYLFWRNNKSLPPNTEYKTQTIYEKDTSNGQYKLERKRTVVPCDPEQLMVFAKGIRESNMTLAINPWQKTIVHKSIDDLRIFMTDNQFAYELRAKRGELAMLPAGDDWLDDCIALGDLPIPYTYAVPSPESNNAPKISPIT